MKSLMVVYSLEGVEIARNDIKSWVIRAVFHIDSIIHWS
jgi:hypothetical protein